MSKKSTLFIIVSALALLGSLSVSAQDKMLMPSILNQKAYQSVRLSLWFSGVTAQSHASNKDKNDASSIVKHPEFLTDKHFLRLIK